MFEEITSVEVFKEGEREKAQQLLSPAEPPHGPENIQGDESLRREIQENLLRQARPPLKKKPQTYYKSSTTEVDAGESGASGGGSRKTSVRIRRRKFEAVTGTDTASYDELNP